MSDRSKIEWTDATWNPVTGCTQVSPGCANCYAKRFAERFRGVPGHHFEHGFDVQLRPEALEIPLHWRKPRRIFVCSMADLFHEAVPDEFIADVFAVMACAPHQFQVLTKRPERMLALLGERATIPGDGSGWHGWWWQQVMPRQIARRWPSTDGSLFAEANRTCQLRNVWLGTSIENERFAYRADLLRQTPAAVRWISAEPLLGPLPSLDLTGIDWLVVGGESGPGARPMNPEWVRDLRDRAKAAGTAFLFKQWGEWAPDWEGAETCLACGATKAAVVTRDGQCSACDGYSWKKADRPLDSLVRIGKHAAGCELDGRTWDEYPHA